MDTTEIEGGERVEMPNGQRVWYFDEDHSYWRCKDDGGRGKRLSGVTTVISPYDTSYEGKQRLLRWAARKNGEGVALLAAGPLALEEAEEIRDGLAWLNTADLIWAELERSQLTFEDIRDAAGTRGTNVHKLTFERLARGEKVPAFDQMTPAEIGFSKGVAAFWLDHSPTAEQFEQVVYSEPLGVAGRLDFRGTLGTRDGIGVIDLKTSGYVGVKDHAQVAGYRHIAEECGFGASDWGAILQVAEDGTYRLMKVVAEPEDFKLAVDIYRRTSKIDREAKDAWSRAIKGGG